MNSESPRDDPIWELISGLDELKKEPWASVWRKQLIPYILVFDVVFIIGLIIIVVFRLIPTDYDNALYFLSAMVQAQAAVITLIISLTLIATQMASTSYTPRVVDVMIKNPDMWYLLIIYIAAISYGFLALKLVTGPEDQFLVSIALILGIYTFCILFFYMKYTIAMLRPDVVVRMLVKEINVENIQQETRIKEGKDDIMQPVFDLVNASISRYDVTTTRTGLKALSERILELFPEYSADGEKIAGDITDHFCMHIQRSALIAFRNDDEGVLKEIIEVLWEFGNHTADKGFDLATERVAAALSGIGVHAADKGLAVVTERVAAALSGIGVHAADKGWEGVTEEVAGALREVGTDAADKGLVGATEEVAGALREVGTHAADKGWEGVTEEVASALREVGTHAADKGLAVATEEVAAALREVGTHAADKGLAIATEEVAGALREVGTHAADKGLAIATERVAGALREVGTHAADKGLAVATEEVAGALREVGTHAADKRLEIATVVVAGALGVVGAHSADKGLEIATEEVVGALREVGAHSADKGLAVATMRVVYSICWLGMNEASQRPAAQILAHLIFQYKSKVRGFVNEFESQVNPEKEEFFIAFKKETEEELHILESEKQPRDTFGQSEI